MKQKTLQYFQTNNNFLFFSKKENLFLNYKYSFQNSCRLASTYRNFGNYSTELRGRNKNRRPDILGGYDYIKGKGVIYAANRGIKITEDQKNLSKTQIEFIQQILKKKVYLSDEIISNLIDESSYTDDYFFFMDKYYNTEKSQFGKPFYLIEDYYGIQDLIWFSSIAFFGYNIGGALGAYIDILLKYSFLKKS